MSNPELELAYKIVANTDTHLFLTGKAGTGKTTFLRSLRESLPKRMIVVAPTGIAAINAQGVTIHSFFQLPFGPHIPGSHAANEKRFQFRKNKLRLIRSVDLIVIDEISMVRADVLDAIDGVLRQYRDHNRPFGGIQMLFIGDMQQLAPVAKEDEWRMLSPYYETPYFFSSRALQSSQFVTVELQHVYRQSDKQFLDILNKVRTNTADDQTLAQLNERYIPDFKPEKKDGYIRLTTHNRQADAINKKEMDAINRPARTFTAQIEKDFPEISYPTEKNLELKEGAQVMFIKNDSSIEKAFYNGMIGEISSFEEDYIVVHATRENRYVNVGRTTWENTRYNLNEETKEITEEVIGTFVQYPLKPAWAITVHKSQGLTFEHAIIDVQHSFAHGQTYVALSRCKTLEGMVLSSPIPRYAIINDAIVENFTHDPRHQQPNAEQLNQMERHFFLRTVSELFSLQELRFCFDALIRLMREYFYASCGKTYHEWLESSDQLKELENVACRFHQQFQRLIMQQQSYSDDPLLQERLIKGAGYFKEQIHFIETLINKTVLNTENKTVKERRDNQMQNIKQAYRSKYKLLSFVAENGFQLHTFLAKRAIANIGDDATSVATNATPAASTNQSKQDNIGKQAYKPWTAEEEEKLKILYRQGKSQRAIAEILNRSKGAISSRIKKLNLQDQ